MTSAERHPGAANRASLAIDNLRAVVILLVLAFHAALAYLNFLPPHPFAFDAPPFLWRAFAIIDPERWLGFDLFCAWLDVYLMSFFFLLSGLFVWPSLVRKGPRLFLAERVLRLGLPFAAVVLLLMPVAHYPTYLQTASEPGLAAFWRHWLALPLWPAGPMWFLWLLLAGDMLAAGLYRLLNGRREAVLNLSAFARRHPGKFLAGFVAASALAYIPLALLFGSAGWTQAGPFSFQLSRPLHYALYFLAGVAIGACGIERGLFAADGPLARCWARWTVAAPALLALWVGLTTLLMAGGRSATVGLRVVDELSFVLACFASSFMTLALAVRFGGLRLPLLDSLKANAYGMYLIHYVFIVWLQYALLPNGAPAILKWLVVFAGALALSWGATAALRRVPAIAQIIGGERRARAAAPRAAPAGGRSAGLAD